ncbi:low molecular weight protein-tyrosine-phosphatase [soil metagenome]
MPYRICFVCLGNICRSPMAGVVMRRLASDAGLADRIVVGSAGTGSWHVGAGANPPAVAALHRRGYDGSSHRARKFGAADFADWDLVVGLDAANVADLRRLAPTDADAAKVVLLRDYDLEAPAGDDPAVSGADRDVPDPYGGPDAEFEHALDLVEAACRGLLATLPNEGRD